MAFNYPRIHQKAHSLITRFGAPAKLRRNGVDRDCVAVMIEYSPREKALVVEGASRVLISIKDPKTRQNLAVPPDFEQDLLVFGGKVWRLVMPDSGPRPNGENVYHEFPAVYDSAA